MLIIPAGNEDFLALSDLVSNFGKYRFDAFEPWLPVAMTMGPGEHHGALRRPFSG